MVLVLVSVIILCLMYKEKNLTFTIRYSIPVRRHAFREPVIELQHSGKQIDSLNSDVTKEEKLETEDGAKSVEETFK